MYECMFFSLQFPYDPNYDNQSQSSHTAADQLVHEVSEERALTVKSLL